MDQATYGVTKVKTFRGREGHGFNATLLRDGKPVALVMDMADGSCARFEWRDRAEEQILEDYLKGMRMEFYGQVMDMTADMFVVALVDEHVLDKLCRRKTVFRLPGDEDWKTVSIPWGPEAKQWLSNKYPGQAVEVRNEKVKA